MLLDDKPITNDRRADIAQVAINAFIAEVGGDFENAIGDLIADLCHLAQREKLDALSQVANGLNHWACEVTDPPDGMQNEARCSIDIETRKYGKVGETWIAFDSARCPT